MWNQNDPLAAGSSYFWVEGHELLRGHQENWGDMDGKPQEQHFNATDEGCSAKLISCGYADRVPALPTWADIVVVSERG